MSDTHNLTGGQIQEVLDFLIYQGLEPIIRHSTVFDIQLIHLLSVASTNKKRKISALERGVFLNHICTALTTSDLELKLESVKSAKIERGFLYNFLINFIEMADGYQTLYAEFLTCAQHTKKKALDKRLAAIERTLCFHRADLFQVLARCRKYVDLAYEFRNSIVEQYIKHAYKQAHAFCKQKGKNFDFNEVYQSLMAAITKAIDKYDSSKGALTSYVNYWILNSLSYAGSDYGHEYGIAYVIPKMQKNLIQGTKAAQVNFSVSLNAMLSSDPETAFGDLLVGSESVESEVLDRRDSDDQAYLIKCADKLGLARLYLDLTEYISHKEKVRMAKTMKRQLGYYPKQFQPRLR
jgi:DNA-directed RNA polymerase sigma subunit (sigma70/sigma32)